MSTVTYTLEYLSHDTDEWTPLSYFQNIVDCYVCLGKHAEADPDMEHRVIKRTEDVVLHLPTREEAQPDG